MKRKTKGQFKHHTVMLHRLRSTIGDSDFMIKENYFRFAQLVTSLTRNQFLHTVGIHATDLSCTEAVKYSLNGAAN